MDQVSRANSEVEIKVKEGGTSLHKTIRKINLVYKGLKQPIIFCSAQLYAQQISMHYRP